MDRLNNFVEMTKFGECGVSYSVVSIIGPQSSGKSTLLNHLFGTRFKEMDSSRRSQTTKGIWIARTLGKKPCTLVIDIEGTDGRERGQDDTVFERQSTLLALVVSDVVLVNMWNITRQGHRKTPLSYLFNIDVVALPHYTYQLEKFKQEVEELGKKISNYTTQRVKINENRRGVVPACGFPLSAQELWKDIKENKDLDLPTHRVMVASLHCDQIVEEVLGSFTENEDWKQLNRLIQESKPLSDFGRSMSLVLDASLLKYDARTIQYPNDVRSAKQEQLKEKLVKAVQPAFEALLKYFHYETFNRFKIALERDLSYPGNIFAQAARDCKTYFMSEFAEKYADAKIKQAKWHYSEARNDFQHNIDAHIAAIRTNKLSELRTTYQRAFDDKLSGDVQKFLDRACGDTWPEIRKIFQHETEACAARYSCDLFGFEIDPETRYKKFSDLKDHARGIIQANAKVVAKNILDRMINRYVEFFWFDLDSKPRQWTLMTNVTEITKAARRESLKVLSFMAAIRLGDDDFDIIEDTLFANLLNATSEAYECGGGSLDPLASSVWDKVPPSETLLTPIECRDLWQQFIAKSQDTVTLAKWGKTKSTIKNGLFTATVIVGCLPFAFSCPPILAIILPAVLTALGYIPDIVDTLRIAHS